MSEASNTVLNAVDAIAQKRSMRGAIRAFKERLGKLEFETMLMASCIVPAAREYLDSAILQSWSNSLTFDDYGIVGPNQDVIIGSGPHAAIYAAIRRQVTGIKPIVLERTERPGGVFAITENPAWYLNSANRPGNGIGVPGQGGQVNYLPGAPVQMADIGMAEYQPNTDLAFLTRLSLAQNANVFTRSFAEDVNPDSGYILVNGRRYYVNGGRIIVATGLGNDKFVSTPPIYNFTDFMRRLDSPFPFRDWYRVAVIGNGDGSRVVVESLLGIGPAMGMSPLSMDSVVAIDWYGRGLPQSSSEWRDRERSRYLRIGKYLNTPKLQIIDQEGYPLLTGPKSVLVANRNYDAAIVCTGYRDGLADDIRSNNVVSTFYGTTGDIPIAKKCNYGPVYLIGPAANLGYSFQETSRENYATFPANVNSLFRYSGKTAALAAIR